MSEHRDEYKRNDLGQFSKGTKGGLGNPFGHATGVRISATTPIALGKLPKFITPVLISVLTHDVLL